ncbi:glycerol acyltransferase [Bacteroidia bacterium]|nr:glycerol acyltransferase [Bacteroidia bacterium]GHT28417.1 glycerol acyltransferase [Bacteroidia bacterium]
MNHFFISAYTCFLSHKKLLIGLLALLTIGLTLSLLRLEYKEDIAEFLPDNETNRQINAVYQHISNSNQLIVNFSMKDSTLNDAERIMEAIDQFVLLLNERDSLHIIPKVISQVDESQFLELTEFIQQNAPYFLTEADYARMDSLLLPDEFVNTQLNEDKRLLMLPSGGLMKQNMVADPLHLFSPLLLKLKDFQAGDNEELNNGYIFSRNGKKGRIMLSSPYGISETAGNAALLEMIDQTIQQTAVTFPDLKISCFGASAIAVANAGQIKKDSLLASILAIVLILALLIYFFRNARNLFLIFFSVLFGWLFALGLLAVFKDSISVIAVGISSIFVGIAINYPLHFIDHLRHEGNRKQALKEIIPPLLIGNITTVGAFLSLLFIDSSAMRDLGLFGSLLLVGTILFVLLFLPHLMKRAKDFKVLKELSFGRLAGFAPERKKWIMWTVLALTVVFLYLSQFTTFEADMNAINYMTEQQREDMNELLQSIEKKEMEIVYFISEGKTMDDALSVYEQNGTLLDSLRQTGMIESISGIGVFLSSQGEQQKRIDRWNDFWKPRRETLVQQIEVESAKLGFKQDSFEDFTQLLYTDFTPQTASYFNPISSLLTDNYLVKGEDRNRIISLLYCEKDNMEQLENALPSNADTFFFDARSIGERMVDSLSGDFNYVLYICGFIVFIFLTFSFGRLEISILSFLPLAVSWVWILGIMQLGNMQFNIVNIILATFIFGQGDDYTIFITEGLMYEYTYRRKMLASYKNSIILSAFIMFIGIGALIFAKHPAVRSLAEVTIIGMFSVVLMAYIIPPFIFRWLTTNKQGFREVPITIKRLAASVLAFTVFLIGSFFITTTGIFLFSFGKKSERKRLRYHSILRWVANFVIRHVPGVKFKYENLSGESFDKPAVIICNHQAHLDLMCLMMLTPKLIILTNDWVWNNPFYGRLIKYADFYPVSNGIEQSIEKLSERVQNGYSIVVFPEGTRSENCSILRFHRGAFYLAEKLQLDILPVFIHGAGHVLPKKDFMLREGTITVQVHPRITPDDSRFAADYTARTKQVRHYYQDTFTALSKQLETAIYFKSFVLHNYLYKGLEIERGVKEEFKQIEKSKQLEMIDNYQGEGPVLIENNGYGVYSFLFALVHKNIQVIATEQDADKVALARSCAGLPKNLTINNE